VGEKGILSPGGTTESAEDEFRIVVDYHVFAGIAGILLTTAAFSI
jgi:hypothetical protein